MMGRCARQGDRGSFSLVILSKLEDMDVTADQVEGWPPAEVHANLAAVREAAGVAEVKGLRDLAKMRIKEDKILSESLTEFARGRAGALMKLIRRYNQPGSLTLGPNGMHVVCCLDESYSMKGSPWSELISAFQAFWATTADATPGSMFASVVQFNDGARTTQQFVPIEGAAPTLTPQWSGTCFEPATLEAKRLIDQYGPSNGYTTVVIFMSDGAAGDAGSATRVLQSLAQQYSGQFESHTVGFGPGAPTTLEGMAFANGENDKTKYRAASVGNLTETFTAVAKSITPGRL